MARETTDPDRVQAGGWRSRPGGEGTSLHRRETMLIVGHAGARFALVVRLYADFWITTIEDWRPDDE